jgi:hypothetical protein
MGKREAIESVNAELREAVFTEDEVLQLIQSSKNQRSYYVEIAKLLDVETAVFLSQVEWRWIFNGEGREPFYKYIGNCANAREGDAWEDELGISKSKLERILAVVSTRVRGKKKAEELSSSGTTLDTLVVYYKPSKGAMVWYLNEKLFLKLRATLLRPIQQKGEMAISAKTENGHFGNLPSSILSEPNHNLSEQETGENLEKVDADDYFNSEKVFDAVAEAQRKAKQEEVKEKANKDTYKPSATFLDPRRKKMPLDFYLFPSTILEAEATGLDNDTVVEEEKKFKNYCTNLKPNTRAVDFQRLFIDWWLVNKKQHDKSSNRKDAGATRLEGLRDLADPDFARGIAEASLEELGESLERYYDSVYGSSDSETY